MIRVALVVPLVLVSLLLAACGDEGDDATATSAAPGGPAEPQPPGVPATGTGTLEVRLEPTEGIFIEGFEVGVRIESEEGEVLHSTLWSELVESSPDSDPSAAYDAVLEREVPAGTVVVRAEANVGIGPPPSVPDVAGALPCETRVEVPEGGTATVEVGFGGGSDCLRVVER